MAKATHSAPAATLDRDYEAAIVASGLVDDVIDVAGLDPRPYRYAEGEFIAHRGDRAESLWIIVTGSVAVRETDRTLFVRQRNEVIGEQYLFGEGQRRLHDLVANESNVEVLAIPRRAIESHREKDVLWRNVAKIISLKLRSAITMVSSLSRQLEDDTRILHAYTNEYALKRRMQAGGGHRTDHKVDRAIVWFSDIADFSRYALTLDPARTADIVQRFFNAQSDPIASHGGFIDKYIGDGLMAFWVIEDDNTVGDVCLEALRAAEEADKAVSRIRIGQQPLRVRIGLHIGLVLSGDFGSARRHQFSLIGPEVNKAARLEQIHDDDVTEGCKEPGNIRLSAEIRKELGGSIQARFNHRSVADAKNIGKLEFYS